MNKVIKNKKSLVWLIVSTFLVVLFTVVTVLSTTLFYDLFNIVLPGGGPKAKYAAGIEPLYVSDYASKAKTLEAAEELNIELCREGFVLLKNENNALPLYTTESPAPNKKTQKPKVSVFGKNSDNLAYGGSGSGGGASNAKSIYDSLKEAGYLTNPELEKFYNSSASGTVRPAKPPNTNLNDGKSVTIATYETPQLSYTDTVRNSYAEYKDAAIVVFTRMAGEGFDLGRTMEGVTGARNQDDYYLQLDQNEADLLKAVCESNFERVIVLINAGTAVGLGFLKYPDYYDYDYAGKIDAALWIGFPGNNGIMALGEILNGNVNPSGRLTDTYVKDFKQDPAWNNFGDNLESDGNQYYLNGTTAQLRFFVDYEEGVYVGYKYYETRGLTESQAGNPDWYNQNVVYPLGHGLSYTDFSWAVSDKSSIDGKTIAKGDTYTVSVTVTNNGPVAGKEVVQLYASAPYSSGEIEKPHKIMAGFAKTELIQPTKSDTVEITFDPYYLASYDYKDQNGNGFRGYELDGGAGYKLFVGRNAHQEETEIPFSVPAAGIKYTNDQVTDNPVVNRFTGQTNTYFNSDLRLETVLSRSDWTGTWPTKPTAENKNVNQAFVTALADIRHNNPNDYSGEEMPYDGMPVTVTFRDMLTNSEGDFGFADDEEDLWKPVVSYKDERWETLLDQCNIPDLINMYNFGAFKSAKIENIGKPPTNDTDGPAGFVNFMDQSGTYWGTMYYCAPIVTASTWNQELAEDFGKMVGNEGIWGAESEGNHMPYSGWYAPGVNLHRSPFGGRNFEYYSEDGILSGKMGAAVVRGCQSKGVYAFVKHFALNEQETRRSTNGLSTWVTEQAMREVYLKPFEIIVKEGGTRAIMSSFNRIGTRWTGGDYRLLTEILRDEWGFCGTVICDFNTIPEYMNAKQMAYAGGDLNLATETKSSWSNFDSSDVADVIVLRKAAQNIFYTVVNSNAMNGEIAGFTVPLWLVLLIIFDVLLLIGLGVWGFFVLWPLYRAPLFKKKTGHSDTAVTNG